MKKIVNNYHKYCVLIYMIFLCSIVSAQYGGEFEEKLFETIKNKGEIKAYDILNAINYDEKLYNKGKNEIEVFVREIHNNKFKSKSLKRKIQTIYKKAHLKFLKKYDDKANFNNVFENGSYNCVSASALYALLFDKFEINYSIKEKPTHVYIIADTLGLQTTVETTLPSSGIFNYNQNFKKNYIDYLKKNKIITENDFNNSTIDLLFKKHFTEDKSISLSKLSAIQYYNDGLFKMDENSFISAAFQFKKAIEINPSSESYKYLYFIALKNALIEDDKNEKFDGKLLGYFMNIKGNDIDLKELGIEYFKNVAHKLCIDSPDSNRFDQFFNDLTNQCPIENLPKDIPQAYHYYKANSFRINSEFSNAVGQIIKAFQYNKNDLYIKDLAQSVVLQNINSINDEKKSIDSIERYFEELPFLKNHKPLQHQYVLKHMKIIYDSFSLNKVLEGEEYYNNFLSGIVEYDIDYIDYNLIDNGLGFMAYYWAREKKFNKAIEVVNNGLSIAPQSLKLKKVKETILESKRLNNSLQNYNRSTIEYVQKSASEELKEKVDQFFPNNWKAKSIIIEETEQLLNENELFQIIAKKNKDCVLIRNGKEEKGKWAYRPKSRCIYFIPDYNKDDYMVFRLKEIYTNKLILLPFKDKKNPSPYKYILESF